jgi:hypothetical protein
MPAHRKTTAEKKLKGTLKKSREAARTKVADPVTELADARETLEAMRHNLRLAGAEIKEHGLMVTTVVFDTHNKPIAAERPNPALKIQREALRAITYLKRQIGILEAELEESGEGKSLLDEFAEFK